MGIVRGICVSPARGTKKTPVAEAVLKEDWGILGDAHAGNWHRQVSLLPWSGLRNSGPGARLWSRGLSGKT